MYVALQIVLCVSHETFGTPYRIVESFKVVLMLLELLWVPYSFSFGGGGGGGGGGGEGPVSFFVYIVYNTIGSRNVFFSCVS